MCSVALLFKLAAVQADVSAEEGLGASLKTPCPECEQSSPFAERLWTDRSGLQSMSAKKDQMQRSQTKMCTLHKPRS
jgi:hypothetical protein